MMLLDPGPDLDRLVGRRLGDPASEADYSTDPTAADRLLACLRKAGLCVQSELADELWYCTLSARAGQRLATGSGSTRELALCRAVSNLPPSDVPEGSGPCGLPAERPRRKKAALQDHPAPAPIFAPETAAGGACQECGAPLPRVRALSPFCPVCSYRRGRQARIDFEARRRNRRRRPPAAG